MKPTLAEVRAEVSAQNGEERKLKEHHNGWRSTRQQKSALSSNHNAATTTTSVKSDPAVVLAAAERAEAAQRKSEQGQLQELGLHVVGIGSELLPGARHAAMLTARVVHAQPQKGKQAANNVEALAEWMAAFQESSWRSAALCPLPASIDGSSASIDDCNSPGSLSLSKHYSATDISITRASLFEECWCFCAW
jgi:hypothetical protein